MKVMAVNVSYSLHVFQILLVIVMLIASCHGHMNMTKYEYERMPSLYKFDNYTECINARRLSSGKTIYPAKYCMVFVQIQPDLNSSLWQQINEYSKASKFHYRHEHLFRGLCLENCNNFKEFFKNSTTTEMDRGLLNTEETKMFSQVHKTSLDHIVRQQYQSEIYECVNREYQENYNLSTKTFIQYCIDPDTNKGKDIYFYITVLMLLILLLLCLFSSLYDAKLKSQQLNTQKMKKYYETKHTDEIHKYLTAFSLYRNYKRLVEIKRSDIGMDLSFLDGFRAILCILIISEHMFLLQFGHLENPKFFETIYSYLWFKSLLTALVWLELFFLLSGLLLYVKFDKGQFITPKSTFGDCIHVYVRLMVSRYLRFLPSLFFIITIAANSAFYSGYVYSRFIIDPNCWNCRENWWQNLLMINNYYLKRACLMHSWYISADFQLYAFYLIVLIIAAKYPRIRIFLFITIAILAAAINVLVNYFLKLDPFFFLELESLRYYFMQKFKTAKYLYFSSYTNLNSFLVGILCGFIYMKYLYKNPKNKLKFGQILKVTPYIGWPIILSISYLGATILYNEPTIWTAMYGLLQRHIALSLVAVMVILRGMCFRGVFLNWAPLRLLSRISFQVYLWQIIVMTYTISFFNEPIHVSYLSLALASACLIIASNIVGFMVTLLVEYPFANICNIIDIESKLKV